MSIKYRFIICLIVFFPLWIFLTQAAPRGFAEREIKSDDLLGMWKVVTTECEGNMWWRPISFSMLKRGDTVYLTYHQYQKKDDGDTWSIVENTRPKEPAGKIFTVRNEFYYFEIEILKAYGIANKARFYMYLDENGKRMRGTYLRTVSFPVDQMHRAEEVLGSSKVLENTEKWAIDSSGNSRKLVDVIVGSCHIVFKRVKQN
jgi:hypothetical protein